MEKKRYSLNELCLKITDGSHYSPTDCEQGTYPMLSVKDMEYNDFNYSNCKHIFKDEFLKLKKLGCQPETNDILIAKDGSYLKYVFKISEKKDICVLSSIAILRPNQEIIDPDYFVYLLRSNMVKKNMAGYVSGSALPRIVLKDFKKMKLNIVRDIKEQQKISSFLKRYDNQIDINKDKIKLITEQCERLYKYFFLSEKYRKKPLVKIQAFDVALETGKRPKGGIDAELKTGIPSLGAECIDKLGCYDFSSTKFVTESFFKTMKQGISYDKDLLIYKDGAYIGKTTLFGNGFPFENYSINEHVFMLIPKDKIYKNYLYFTLNRNCYFNLMQLLNKNAAQPGLTKNDIINIKISMPTKEDVVKFNDLVGPLIDEIFNLSKMNYFIEKQRDVLINTIITGKVIRKD